MEIWWRRESAVLAMGRRECAEARNECRPDFGSERQVDVFALVLYMNQTDRFEFFNMVRECGWRNIDRRARFRATHAASRCRNALQQFKSPGIGQRL